MPADLIEGSTAAGGKVANISVALAAAERTALPLAEGDRYLATCCAIARSMQASHALPPIASPALTATKRCSNCADCPLCIT